MVGRSGDDGARVSEVAASGRTLPSRASGSAAPGVRMQNFEIKYKKPTTILGRDSQGRGQQISGALGREPRGYLAQMPADFQKLFLLPAHGSRG
jgi:hypothetical protein